MAVVTIEQFGYGLGTNQRTSRELGEALHTVFSKASEDKQGIMRGQFIRGWMTGNLQITSAKADFYVFELTRAQRQELAIKVKGAMSTVDKAYDAARGAFRDNVASPHWMRAKGAKVANKVLVSAAQRQALTAALAAFNGDTKALKAALAVI